MNKESSGPAFFGKVHALHGQHEYDIDQYQRLHFTLFAAPLLLRGGGGAVADKACNLIMQLFCFLPLLILFGFVHERFPFLILCKRLDIVDFILKSMYQKVKDFSRHYVITSGHCIRLLILMAKSET